MERKKETKNFGGNVARLRGEPWEWAGCLTDKVRRVGLGTSCHWPGFCLAGSSLHTHTHTQSTAQMPLGLLAEGEILTASPRPSLAFCIPCTLRGSQGCAGGWEGHLEGEGQI